MKQDEIINTLRELITAKYDENNILLPLETRKALSAAVEILSTKEQVSTELNEAAEKAGLEYAPMQEGEAIDANGDVYATDDVEWPSRCGFIHGFKAGAKWMAKQGVTFECSVDFEAPISPDDSGFYLDCTEQEQFTIEALGLKVMDEVIVQIRPKK